MFESELLDPEEVPEPTPPTEFELVPPCGLVTVSVLGVLLMLLLLLP